MSILSPSSGCSKGSPSILADPGDEGNRSTLELFCGPRLHESTTSASSTACYARPVQHFLLPRAEFDRGLEIQPYPETSNTRRIGAYCGTTLDILKPEGWPAQSLAQTRRLGK